jgi:hypothetical protein
MSDLITAIGLVLVIEGLFYAAFPGAAKRMMAFALQSDDTMLRRAGVTALAGGVLLVWLVRA